MTNVLTKMEFETSTNVEKQHKILLQPLNTEIETK